jgi:hypothetical protein
LGPLVELASDLDNYNTEVPGIKKNCGQWQSSVEDNSWMFSDGYPTQL